MAEKEPNGQRFIVRKIAERHYMLHQIDFPDGSSRINLYTEPIPPALVTEEGVGTPQQVQAFSPHINSEEGLPLVYTQRKAPGAFYAGVLRPTAPGAEASFHNVGPEEHWHHISVQEAEEMLNALMRLSSERWSDPDWGRVKAAMRLQKTILPNAWLHPRGDA